MPGNVSAPQAAGLSLLAGLSGTARKGEQSQTDPAFAALLAMLVGQGMTLPVQLTTEFAPVDGQPATPAAVEALVPQGKAPTEPELIALLLQAGLPVEEPTGETAPAQNPADLLAATVTPADQHQAAPVAPVASGAPGPVQPAVAPVQIAGTSIFENTERDEEPAPVRSEPLPADALVLPAAREVAPLAEPAEVQLPEPLRRLAEAPLPADGLMRVVSEAAVKTQPGEYTVTLRLHPQELGEVKLQLHLNGRQVQTVMEVAHPQVQRTLESQGDALRQSLTQAGFTLSGFEVSTGRGGQSARDRQEQLDDLLRTQRRGRTPAPVVTPGAAPSVLQSGRTRSGGRLDTTA